MGTKQKFLLLLAMHISATIAIPLHTESMVVSTTAAPKETSSEVASSKEDTVPIVPKIYEMKVNTNVSNRFAKTEVLSKVKNLAKTAQEATFSVVLPETAYISGFVMEIDGKSYKAYVKEKEEAKQIYTEAVSHGQSAAHVEANARDSNRFTVSLNIEPQTKAIFTLTYEELLQRQNEQYEIVINIHPGQPVKDLNVEVHINESRPLKFVKSPPLRSGNEISKNDDDKLASQAVINTENSTTATVKFNPNVERQKQLASGLGTKEENGLAGQFVVQYDVERDPQGGEVLVKDGYFVHFFAPSDVPPLPKQVVFVLDTSGSMDGIRIKQLKEAMNSILAELKAEDLFNIVEFSSTVKVWNIDKVEVEYELGDDPWPLYTDPEQPKKNKTSQVLPPPYPATEDNINKARKVVEKLNAYGGTDIKSALEIGLKLVKKGKEDASNKNQPIIVFLTDGEPTVGEVMPKKIITAISDINSGALRTPIFSLSFGDGADRDFLQKISLKNLGFARHIYEAADASLQLQEFYKQISSPLLNNVHFKYVSNVTKLTKTEFPIFFHGSELVVAGVSEDEGFTPPQISGNGFRGPIEWTPKVETPVGDLERLWAYLTTKQILEAREAAENKTQYTKKALDIALKYGFVTAVSSLVVVKPNDTSAVDTQDASKGSEDSPHFVHRNYAMGGGFGAAPALSPPGPVPLSSPNTASYSSFSVSKLALQPQYVVSDPQPYRELKQGLPWLGKVLLMDGTMMLSAGAPTLSLGQSVAHFSSGAANSLVAPAAPLPPQQEQLPPSSQFYEEDEAQVEEDRILVGITKTNRLGVEATTTLEAEVQEDSKIVGGAPQTSPPVVESTTTLKVEDDSRIVGGASPHVVKSTTSLQDPHEEIKNQLPWLKDILLPNGTLMTSSGDYKLTTDHDTVTDKPECRHNPINGSAGVCTPLKECPQVFPHLTDVKTFNEYFCPLDRYAGICCPTSTDGASSKN